MAAADILNDQKFEFLTVARVDRDNIMRHRAKIGGDR